MPTNFYFDNFAHSGQQNLIEDLITESIKIYGYDNFYIPRTLVKEDNLFGEDVLSKFDSAYPIEMYIKNVEGFDGEGEFLSRFNVEVRDSITFSMSQKRWQEEIPDGSKKTDNQGDLIQRPTEGDLIFFPLTGQLYEIKYVDKQPIFYQLGQLQMFDLRCELFEFSHERVTTGVKAIDDLAERHTINVLNFQILIESAKERAIGTATTTNDKVTGVIVNSPGDYTTAPTLTFSPPPAAQVAVGSSTISGDRVVSATVDSNNQGTGYVSGVDVPVTFSNPTGVLRDTAEATATISGGVVNSVTVTNPGNFYNIAPTVGVTASPTGDDAILSSSIGNNSVLQINIVSGGSGYTTAPTVTIGDPQSASEFRAQGIATANAKGNISTITITDGGKYYASAPTVIVGNPPDSIRAEGQATLTGTGVTSVTNQGRGYVQPNGTLITPIITFSTETFDTGVGIKLEDNSGLLLERTANTVNVNSTANNEFFETSKSGFIDFSELNPFSEGTDW